MMSMMAKFWLRRFVTVAGIVCAALLIIEFAKNGGNVEIGAVLIWALVSGAIAATTGTWWARNRGCGLPQK
ncbi:MAG: hypothetical protein ACRBF0_04410 [Calditrichia bacterium]